MLLLVSALCAAGSPALDVLSAIEPEETVQVTRNGDWFLARVVEGANAAVSEDAWHDDYVMVGRTHSDQPPVRLVGMSGGLSALSATGRALGVVAGPGEGSLTLTLWNPRGDVIASREYTSPNGRVQRMELGLSDAGDRVFVLQPIENGGWSVELLDATFQPLTTVEAPDTYLFDAALSGDGKSIVLLSNGSMTEINGEMGAVRPQVPTFVGQNTAMDEIVGWIDGHWLLSRRSSVWDEPTPYARLTAADRLEVCFEALPNQQVHAIGDSWLFSTRKGVISSWQGCGTAPQHLATVPPPPHASTELWLTHLFHLDDHPWAIVDRKNTLHPLTPDYQWP